MSIRVKLNPRQKCPFGAQRSRYVNTGNTLHPDKMQTKLLSSQWKLINYIKKLAQTTPNHSLIGNNLNKKFAQFLQQIQPSVYSGSDLVKYFDTFTSVTESEKLKKENVAQNESEGQQSSTSPSPIPKFLDNILTQKELKKITPKWKEAHSVKEYVALKTTKLLTTIALSTSNDDKYHAIEELNALIKEHPEAKHMAVKEGGIRYLLKTYHNCKKEALLGLINECLTRLGYVHPVSGEGARILSIDGGGVRGILVIEMLKKLEELSGKRIHEMFDIICGVSTGAIIATLIGTKQKTLDEISEIYRTLSTQIFDQSPLKGTSNLVWTHSYYDTALWEKLLKDTIGEDTLISTSRNLNAPKVCILSAIVNESRLAAYIFRNYSLPCRVQSRYRGNHEHKIWEAVRASAAAPTYFEEFKLGNMLLQDGGILINNPTAVALHEAKLLWPNTPIQCVISFGTGRTVPNITDHSTQLTPVNSSSWKNKFYAIIESATDTEGVNVMLSDLLPGNVYYRFNPYLTEMLDIAEIDPKKIEQLERDAVMYLRRNEDKFQEAGKALTKEKPLTNKAKDWIQRQAEMNAMKVRI